MCVAVYLITRLRLLVVFLPVARLNGLVVFSALARLDNLVVFATLARWRELVVLGSLANHTQTMRHVVARVNGGCTKQNTSGHAT